jgi:hypothetical protein
MTPIHTIALTDAIGKTVQASHLDENRLTLLWTDQTATTIKARSYEGDPELDDDAAGTTLDQVVDDRVLVQLGLLTSDERRQRQQESRAQYAAELLASEQRDYLRLKAKFEQQGQP